jgi:hypothetical protein
LGTCRNIEESFRKQHSALQQVVLFQSRSEALMRMVTLESDVYLFFVGKLLERRQAVAWAHPGLSKKHRIGSQEAL